MLGTRFDRRLFKDTPLVTQTEPSRPLLIGLTGGIGSGKTTVSGLFQNFGINIIDTDIIAREIVEPDQKAYDEIVDVFGSKILSKNRDIDRKKLRQLVFDQPKKLSQLEKITHPRIISTMREQISQTTSPYCILCIPLLFEKELQREVDRVLVVDVPTEIQKQRVANRDNNSKAQVEAIMKHQLSRNKRLLLADDVIKNEGSLSDLQSQVQDLHARYLTLAEAHENTNG